MAFSSDFIDKVLEASDLVDHINQDTQLKGAGTRLMGLCPFPDHNEKSPSFSVSRDKQVYHCFGCKKSGNLITYLQQHRGMSFPEAIEFLADRAGIAISEEELGARYKRPEEASLKRELYKINELAALFFHRRLIDLKFDHSLRAYLSRRGYNAETVSQFRLGYSPDSWDELVKHLKAAKASLPLAEQLGLLKTRSSGQGQFDMFRDRLMFPIISPMGQVIGFGGRIIEQGEPKYLNSPESPLFHKGRSLYGLNESARHIRAADEVILVEGYTDFLALFQSGVCHVAATLGTALTSEHAQLIRRYTKNVIVLFDGDSAGQRAAEKSLPVLLAAGLFPKQVCLDDNLDPDEFIQLFGRDLFLEKLKLAQDLFMYLLEKKVQKTGTQASDKVQLIDELRPSLQAMLDHRLRDLYLNEISWRIAVEKTWLINSLKLNAEKSSEQRGAIGKANTRSRSSNSSTGDRRALSTGPLNQTEKGLNSEKAFTREPTRGSKIQLGKAPKSELWLLNLALMKKKYWNFIQSSGIMDCLTHPGVVKTFYLLVELDRQAPEKFDNFPARLTEEVEPVAAISLHLSPMFSDLNDEQGETLLEDCVKKIKENWFRSQSRALALKVSQKAGAEPRDASNSELEQIMNIHKDRRSLENKK